MAKIRKNLTFVAFVILLITASFILGMSYTKVRAGDDLEKKLEVFLQVLDIVKSDYIVKELDNTNLVYGSIRGLLSSLDDPYTRFMEPKAYKEMKIRMSGIYSGVGIYIGIKEEQLVVISPIPGTPAGRAGLKSRDKIMTIDGKSTKDMALEEAVSLIRGKPGTVVKLGIIRGKAKEPKIYEITREKIKIKSIEKKDVAADIGYIKIVTFENIKTADEMTEALREVKKENARGLIVDLRDNGGGLLQNAIDIGSMFIKRGIIVYTIDREGGRESISSSGRVVWEKPTVVLINGASASASEILAGALRDNKVATLVGTHTFGKASVQNVRTLDDGSALLLTIAKYLTPNGDDITEKGIIPDIVVELPEPEEEEVWGRPEIEEDIQLQKAIEILKEKIGI